MHVDAYRLGDLAEVDDLDLDASLEESVTVVEWGEGKVEGLAQDRLQITLHRGADVADETRTASAAPGRSAVGGRRPGVRRPPAFMIVRGDVGPGLTFPLTITGSATA